MGCHHGPPAAELDTDLSAAELLEKQRALSATRLQRRMVLVALTTTPLASLAAIVDTTDSHKQKYESLVLLGRESAGAHTGSSMLRDQRPHVLKAAADLGVDPEDETALLRVARSQTGKDAAAHTGSSMLHDQRPLVLKTTADIGVDVEDETALLRVACSVHNSKNALMKKGAVSWECRLKTLHEYKRKYGDCNVSRNSTKYRALGIWVMNERANKKKFDRGERSARGNLTIVRVSQLDAIGFN